MRGIKTTLIFYHYQVSKFPAPGSLPVTTQSLPCSLILRKNKLWRLAFSFRFSGTRQPHLGLCGFPILVNSDMTDCFLGLILFMACRTFPEAA